MFHNKSLGVSVMVHGNDFVAIWLDKYLAATQKTLEDKYKLKVEVLGHGEGKTDEMRILNKVVRMTTEGIALKADPRHSEFVVTDFGLETSKVSAVPGSKEEQKRAPARPASAAATPAGTQARINVEIGLDSI